MVAVLVGIDSTVVNEERYHEEIDHGYGHIFLEPEEVYVARLNIQTRKLHRRLNGNCFLSFELLNEGLRSWMVQSKMCRGTSAEDVLIGYCQYVLEMNVNDIADIVHSFHTWRVSLTSERTPLPKHVWLRILEGRYCHGPMGLDEKCYLEV